jgi:hypothetical protein
MKKNSKWVIPDRVKKAFTKKAMFNCWKLSVALFIFVWLYEFANQVVFVNFDSVLPAPSINWNSIIFQRIPFLIVMSFVFAFFMWVLALFSPETMGSVFRMLGFEKEKEKKNLNENKPQEETVVEEKISKDEKERDKLIYEIIVNRHDQELQRTNDLDSKANNLTGFSGVLAGLMVALFTYLPEDTYSNYFLVPMVLLIAAAVMGFWTFRIKTYSSIEPCQIIEQYADKTYTQTLREYATTTAQNTMQNHNVNEQKAKSLKYSFELVIIAISLFFVIAILNWGV